MLFFHKPGIVNVKMINPNNKKQIIQLEEDAFFKDLIDSIKTYLIEYPKKKNFPADVYKAAYGLVEYTTNQFEENTKQIEKLIRQREQNICTSNDLKDVLEVVENKEKDWKSRVKEISPRLSEDAVEALITIGKSKKNDTENYEAALKLIKAKISNLESNLHIEIDMERIEDRSKALSYIGIEIAEALKGIPAPVVEESKTDSVVETEEQEYIEQTRFEVKPSLWQRIKNSKLVRAIQYICKVKVVLALPEALPEGNKNK